MRLPIVWDVFGAEAATEDGNDGSITCDNTSDISAFLLVSTDFLENVLPLDDSGFAAPVRTSDVARLGWSII